MTPAHAYTLDQSRQESILTLEEVRDRIAELIAAEFPTLVDGEIYRSGCIGPTKHAEAVKADAMAMANAALLQLSLSNRACISREMMAEAIGI